MYFSRYVQNNILKPFENQLLYRPKIYILNKTSPIGTESSCLLLVSFSLKVTRMSYVICLLFFKKKLNILMVVHF